MVKIILILLLIVSLYATSESAFQRKKSSNNRRVDHSKTYARPRHGTGRIKGSNRRGGEVDDSSDNTDYSDEHTNDEGFQNEDRSDESQNTADYSNSQDTSEDESFGPRLKPATTSRAVVDSIDSSGEAKNVDETKRDLTLEDFGVQNKELRDYVVKLRKRVARLQKIRVKFGKVQSNYALRHRMDTVESKYLNNIAFIEENQDYNQTLVNLISIFNDRRKNDGWTQMVDVDLITVKEMVKNEARNERFVFRGLPKTFLTRYEKWYAGTEWLQSLSPERVRELRKSYPALYRIRKGIFEQFQERPISSNDVGAGMDTLYGIVSENSKGCLEISHFEMHKILKQSLISYNKHPDEAVSKCANVLISLKKI